MSVSARRWPPGAWWLAMAAMLVLARCDSVEPVEPDRLVVEAFFDAGRPLPPVTLRRTLPLGEPYEVGPATAVTDAEVVLDLDGQVIAYGPDTAAPGRYRPVVEAVATPRAPFVFTARWRGQEARAAGTIPPPIHLDTVEVSVPERPVQAVLLDSLNLAIDSLSVGARQGFIYPVEVTLRWEAAFEPTGADSLYWVETRLEPRTGFASAIIDFFLLPSQILRERDRPRDARGRYVWTGVYAIPVEEETDPLPPHELTVALLRSGRDYARFASTRDAPDRREPRTNVTGGLGIVAGVSVDSLRLRIEPGAAPGGNTGGRASSVPWSGSLHAGGSR